ncbi:MAG: hypothetical protein RSB90_09975, partial [Eubacterium sp.]
MMKKRASLLISGITTAALVVTAIGSFAAWQTLTADSKEAFTTTTNNPVVLAVKTVDTGFKGKQLVPVGAKTDVGSGDAAVVEALVAE